MDSIASEYKGGYPVVVEVIKYHTDWPGYDKFNAYNPYESAARTDYYGINATPTVVVDGGPGSRSYSALWGDVVARLLIPTPLEIAVTDTLIGDSVYVNAQVIATGTVDSKATYKFRCAAVELTRPGGGRDNWYIMRDMVPNQVGDTFSISTGDTVTFERVWWMDTGTYIDWKMRTTVFVQNDVTKEIIQSASTWVKPNYFLLYLAERGNSVIPPGNTDQFVTYAYNLGKFVDTYDADMTSAAPPGWTVSYTTSQGTYTGPSQFTLNAGEVETLLVNVDPASLPGYDSIQMEVVSPGDTTTRYADFNALHDVDVVLVDDDGDDSFEGYFEAALDSTPYTHGTWNRGGGSPTATDLSYVDAVVWMTGFSFPTLTADDRSALADHLDNGGNLFATGQDIGWSLCDLASDEYSAAAKTWYETYLGARYLADDTNDLTLNGVAGDPISDGMTLTISGGDGADNQAFPSQIEPLGAGTEVFKYDATKVGAVKNDPGSFKTVYMAFGFEAINNPDDRGLAMDRIMDWFLGLQTNVDEAEIAAASTWLGQNTPNPFNPETAIAYSLRAKGRAKLAVYNVQGQMVRVLDEGILEAGEHVARWDGTDQNGSPVASGLYYCALETEDLSASKKMILLR